MLMVFYLVQATNNEVDDLFRLLSVKAWSILHQIRLRYFKGKYFTSIGPIMITVNPYQNDLPLYAPETRMKYLKGSGKDPHLYEVWYKLLFWELEINETITIDKFKMLSF